MNFHTLTVPIADTFPLAAQTATDDGTASTQLAVSSELGLVALGLVLVGASSFVFLTKLCKSLASNGEK